MRKMEIPEMRLKDDQICKVWRGRARNYDSNFFLLHNARDTGLLYRDGKLAPFYSYYGGPIYPFSKDPTKKKPFFQRRACKEAAFVCVSKEMISDIAWGLSDLPFKDERTGRTYQIGLWGKLYYSLNGNPLCADKIHQDFFSEDDSEVCQKKFRDFIRDCITRVVEDQFQTTFQNFLKIRNFALESDVEFHAIEMLEINKMLWHEVFSRKESDLSFEYGINLEYRINGGSFVCGMICKEI